MSALRRRASPVRIAERFWRMVVALAWLAAAVPALAAPLPIVAPSVFLSTPLPSASYSVDLGTLPTRPELVVEVAADGFHLDMLLAIETFAWTDTPEAPGNCPNNVTPPTTAVFGRGSLVVPLWDCDPRPGRFAGGTVGVRVRALGFGAFGSPAIVAITIRGATHVATGTLATQVDTNLGPRQVVIPASRDTVLYAEDFSASNGAGEFLWAGDRLVSAFPFSVRRPRHALLAFDVTPGIPPVSSVLGAELRLGVTSGSHTGEPLRIESVASSPSGSWVEGGANAPGDEFIGISAPSSAADWSYRARPSIPWTTPGGDVVAAPVAETQVFASGPLFVSTSALASAVQAMVTKGDDANGFRLSSPNPAIIPRPIQLASRENLSGAQTPELVIDYAQSQVYETGQLATGLVSFIGEGQDFRWIYDLDQDDVFVTGIGGVCEVDPTPTPLTVPWTYRFQGTPGFTGVDCCTWNVDSPETGTVGTGQALFFHNLDASNPANMPPDGDGDGIRDLCDNCPARANGPLRGTCLVGTLGATCRSNAECGPGGRCNLSQEDSDKDFVGNACSVPEPGFGAALVAGLGLLAALRRAR
ncbi:MAG: hypothetical protein IPK00_05070 [Deltaproteobacteria bacterium]|nr:hypothetical protein [Deltaproteobacteria bacterium]